MLFSDYSVVIWYRMDEISFKNIRSVCMSIFFLNVCTCKPCKVHTCIIVHWSWNLQKLLEIMNIFETTVLYNVHCFAKRKVNDWVICVTDLDNYIFSDNERQSSLLIGPYLFISQLWLVLIFSSHWAVSFSSASKTNFKLNKMHINISKFEIY